MALLEMTSDVNTVSVAVRGPVDRDVVDQLRSVLGTVVAPASPDAAMELDLREATSFPRLGIGVPVPPPPRVCERLRTPGQPQGLRLVRGPGLGRPRPRPPLVWRAAAHPRQQRGSRHGRGRGLEPGAAPQRLTAGAVRPGCAHAGGGTIGG